ncbi:GTPase IMAP family member 8-like isoform X1 [Astyanax mexicanus]|uniref:GTPase IMAP family member 8-like isoform X1 n=1 Tax=Astyanax mexicanus TaxID=7994 RepID=UPI0020CAC3D4|nr:GTPase IMAP family member 8-like isoform X1 [Astyanax mexicanus]
MELRAVMFGGKFSGKTSLINAVFGQDLLQNQKRTAQCQKHQGNVCGRELTLVDTPGWWKHFPLSDTATFLKQELIQGVYLVNPGPHAIILAIEIDIPFTEKHRKAAEDHLGLLGGQIWKYALVVFTRSHSLRERNIEEHIEHEGEALQWLIEKCGNRYCEFDTRVPNNTSQIKQMLEMIDNIVQSNSSGYFQIEAKILEEAAKRKKIVMTNAKSRELKQLEQRKELNKDELRIALLGWVIAGKSSAGNTILNKQVFVTGQSTVNCKTAHGEVDERPVTVLDTPSWFKYFPSQFTPPWIKSEILENVRDTFISPNCILLVIPGDTSFKKEQKKVIEENMSFLGEQVWRHTIVLFTWGDILGDLGIEQHIESEGEALQWVIDKCENRYHIFNNEERENRLQVTELFQKIDEMMARNNFFVAPQEEVNTRSECGDTENNLQDIVRYVAEEWRRRDNELLKRIAKMTKCIKKAFAMHDISEPEQHKEKLKQEAESASNKSIDFPPDFKGVEKIPLELPKDIKDMLDREWSRREEAAMGRVQEMLSDLICASDTSSTTKPETHSEKQVSLTEDVLKRFSKNYEKEALTKSDPSMAFPAHCEFHNI